MATASGSRGAHSPLVVKVVVYDLLPPSRLGSFLNLIGSGVYHSSVQLLLPLGPTDLDPQPAEWAFGGHDEPGLTGVFSIPAGTAAQRMPGLRYYTTLDLGPAFGPDWQRVFGNAQRKPSTRGIDLRRPGSSPYEGWAAVHSRSTVDLARPGEADDPFRDPATTAEDGDENTEDWDDDDGGASDGTDYMTVAERRAYRIIQGLKSEWPGTGYRLLERNCNHFTHELVWRLTGRRAPAWLNRAAWFATSIPCIVPAGWVNDADEAAPTAVDSAAVHVPNPAHLFSNEEEDSTFVIKPPRADEISMGGRQ